MNEPLALVLAWAAGGLLGGVFFGGLYWTVHRAVSSERPALWFAGSLILRMGTVLAGFYFVGRNHWERLLLCLLGFAMARLAVTWITRPSRGSAARPAAEASHAP